MILDIMILLILLKDISVILISYTCKVYVWNKKKLKYNKMTTSISSKEHKNNGTGIFKKSANYLSST